MSTDMTSIHFRIPRDLERRLRIIAATQDKDKSKLLVEIARKYIEWYEKNEHQGS